MPSLSLNRVAAQYVHVRDHIADGAACLLRHGGVFAMVEVGGVPWETADPEIINSLHFHLNLLHKNLASIADNLTVHVWNCRSHADPSIYPVGRFRSAFAEALDIAYRERLLDKRLFVNRTFVGVVIEPMRIGNAWITKHVRKRVSDERDAPEARVSRLEHVVSVLTSTLSRYQPRRLGTRAVKGRVFSEIAEALMLAMTGVWRPVGMTTGSLGDVMFSERVIVGRETVEIRGAGRSRYAACFSMLQYPAWTWPGVLNPILSAPFCCTLHQSYRYVPKSAGITLMQRKQNYMLAADDPAISQREALTVAADEVGSGEMVLGEHSLVLTAFSERHQAVPDVATAAWQCLQDSGCNVAREDKALEAAYFSMLPMNSQWGARPAYMVSRNFAAMAPFHAFPTGERKGYWGDPVCVFRSSAGTHYYYHFHDGDRGNTFISGLSGSGKSVMIGWIVAQSEKLGAQAVVVDKDEGLKILVYALGGKYLTLGNPTGLAPLKALTDSDEDVTFLTRLIQGLIASGGHTMTPEETRRLEVALRAVMSLPPEYRDMGEVRAFLGVGADSAGAHLLPWCWGQANGWVVDCPEDIIDLDAPVLGFDQTQILDDPVARGPALATLFHRFERLIDGRRLLFVIDEAWKAMLDLAFRDLVHDRLKTLRKRNAAMILATQSPKDALSSPIGHTVREQAPNQFYFANPHAVWADYGDEGMHLSRSEFEIVKNLLPGSGEFLLKQSGKSVRAQLLLEGMHDEIAVISGREAAVRMFDRVRSSLGDAAPPRLISEFHRLRKAEVA